MPFTLYESGDKKDEKKSERLESSILEGTVVNNCRRGIVPEVLVRIPSLGEEVWARLTGPGGGAGTGQEFTPNLDTEVLVGFSGNSVDNAYILNGLWNTVDSPPAENDLTGVPTKRVIKTGLKGVVGHTLEFDDGVNQSITITTSAKQKIVLDKEKIELSTLGDSVKITLDLKTQKVSIQALQIEIGGAKTLSLKLNAQKIDIGDSKSQTTIKGTPVMLN